MKKTLMLAMFVTAVALPAFSECASYIDSRAFSNDSYTFCWLSGAICYNCYNLNTGSSCASDWSPCDPNPHYDPVPPIIQARLTAPLGTTSSACQQPPVLRHNHLLRLKSGELL